MIYILWPEDGLKQRPKHVVSLNKTKKKQVMLWLILYLHFSVYTYKHDGNCTSIDLQYLNIHCAWEVILLKQTSGQVIELA